MQCTRTTETARGTIIWCIPFLRSIAFINHIPRVLTYDYTPGRLSLFLVIPSPTVGMVHTFTIAWCISFFSNIIYLRKPIILVSWLLYRWLISAFRLVAYFHTFLYYLLNSYYFLKLWKYKKLKSTYTFFWTNILCSFFSYTYYIDR